MASNALQGVGLIEKDTNDEVLWVWSYPTVEAQLRNLLMRKCPLTRAEEEEQQGGGDGFSFGHFSNVWYYLSTHSVPEEMSKLPKVSSFCVVVLAKEFNPEKYDHLASIFAHSYLSSGSPVAIVTHYLSAFTKGQVTQPPSSCKPFSAKNYDIRKAYITCSFREVLQQFGVESILIMSALLLKKKVVVYSPSLSTLLGFCRTLPLFVWHRQDWNIVFPQVMLEEVELADLASHGAYVAGFVDATVEGRTDLYDLFVNVPAGSLSIAPHAKESFGMSKIHKDLAMRMMECLQDEEMSDQATVKEVSIRTRELLNNLGSLAPEGGKITLNLLHARKLTPATENFLYSLAIAEGLAQL